MEKEFKEGERMYVEYGTKNEITMHKDRYKLASKYIDSDSIVLDAASGSGYGSKILSEKAKKVYGMEINKHAFSYAVEKYEGERLHFKNQDLNNAIDFDDNFFDVIVSFETIEHLESPDAFVNELRRVLKPGGKLIISTPDREIITDKAHAVNKFHISELSKDEFVNVISKYFKIKEFFGQLKYSELSLFKKIIKQLAKLDIFRIKRFITKKFKLQNFVHKNFAPEQMSEIEKLDINGPNIFFHLIIVAQLK